MCRISAESVCLVKPILYAPRKIIISISKNISSFTMCRKRAKCCYHYHYYFFSNKRHQINKIFGSLYSYIRWSAEHGETILFLVPLILMLAHHLSMLALGYALAIYFNRSQKLEYHCDSNSLLTIFLKLQWVCHGNTETGIGTKPLWILVIPFYEL